MSIEERIENSRRVLAKIDLDAILGNVEFMKKRLQPDTKMMAVIKTDGYGHGSIPIAKCLEQVECIFGYATATPEEAFCLREHGIKKPILILGYCFPYAYERLIQEEIRIAVFEKGQLASIREASRKTGKPMKVHIKVDTGMGRIGIEPNSEGLAFVEEVKEAMHQGALEVEGIFTHFAKADEADKSHAIQQYETFQAFAEKAQEKLEITDWIRHCSNSAGILEMPMANMDMVRAGITLYGLRPSFEVESGVDEIKPVLSLKSTIVYLKTVEAGQSISYGGTYVAPKRILVATIPVGYGDGYPRSLSYPNGAVLIKGHRAPILGRVCMDQFMVDVSELGDVAIGDEVTLIGRDGSETISMEELGAISGRFHYELACDLGKRIPREFVLNGKAVAYQDTFGYVDSF